MYCGVNNLNGALLKAQISVDAAFSGIRVELVIGSEEEGEPSTESSAASAAVTSSIITSDLASVFGLTTKSTGFTTGNSTVPHCPSSSILLEPIDASSMKTSIDSVESLDSSVSPTKRSSGSIPLYPTTMPHDISKSTMTGIVVPIVDPNNPSSLTVTEFCTTLRPPPCRHWETAASHTKDHPAQKTDRVLYHEPEPHVQGDAPGQKSHPDEGDSHAGHQPQGLSPEAGSQSYEYGNHEAGWPQTHIARPTAVGNTNEQSNSATETSPVLLAEETKHAHKFAPSAGLNHSQSQRPTYYHKPGPVPIPIMPGSSPDASVAVVSGAPFKTMDGLLVTIVVAGLVLLL
ncbi:hypothetical protein HG530_003236 [Fusarium avenaceum]|nr:hypothetical protein HG530_003236 [Fusarium avenaceum]